MHVDRLVSNWGLVGRLSDTSGEAASVALVMGNHRQALCWAALVTLVAPATAPLAALGLQQASAGVALACRQWHLGHQLVPPGTTPVVL